MSVVDYEAANTRLFDAWEQKLKESVHVGVDGAVDPAKYYASEPRILFVLKEMNASPWARQNLRKHLVADDISWKTWNNIVRWSDVIRQVMQHDGRKNEVVTFEQDASISASDRKEALSHVAVINMKKMPGGSTGNMPTIIEHAEHFKHELQEQVKMLDPDVIVACGVWLKPIAGFEELKEEAAKKKRSFLLHKFDGRTRIILYIDHSQAYRSAANMVDQIVQACYAAKEELAG